VKHTFVAVALAALALVAPLCRAADAPRAPEPVLVATFSGYDAWRNDIKYLGTLAESPELATLLEQKLKDFQPAAGLAGLDKSRPWGAALRTEGLHAVELIGFLPVTDLKRLLILFTPGDEKPEDVGDGVWRVNIRFAPFFIKEHKTWAYVTGSREALAHLPDDPLAWLKGLDRNTTWRCACSRSTCEPTCGLRFSKACERCCSFPGCRRGTSPAIPRATRSLACSAGSSTPRLPGSTRSIP
jgi:hypothetical protein